MKACGRGGWALFMFNRIGLATAPRTDEIAPAVTRRAGCKSTALFGTLDLLKKINYNYQKLEKQVITLYFQKKK